MTLINTVNVGGTDFGLLNNTVMGVCSTPAGSEVKACTFADNFELKAGVVVTIKFTYANTYGDGSTTYPKLSINGVTGAIRNASGSLASNGAWAAQALVPFIFDGTDFTLLVNPVTDTVASDNMYSVSSKGVSGSIAAVSLPHLYPSSLTYTPGDTVSIADFLDSVCQYLGKSVTCINLHCIWSYAEAIIITAGNVLFTSAGLQLIGCIGVKETWRKYQLIALTDMGDVYYIQLEYTDNYNPTVTIRQMTFAV